MALTKGVHHVGLTVSKLEESAQFFTQLLGWQEVKRNDEYPAIFVSDGHIMLTLWATKDTDIQTFDKNKNVGLHHIALHVGSESELHDLNTIMQDNAISVEFKPEYLQQGPAMHMMCYEPSGIRVEFIWPGESH